MPFAIQGKTGTRISATWKQTHPHPNKITQTAQTKLLFPFIQSRLVPPVFPFLFFHPALHHCG